MYWQRPVANVTDIRSRSSEQAFNDVHISHAACSINAPTKAPASLLVDSLAAPVCTKRQNKQTADKWVLYHRKHA
jgi:hypothetical protein